MAFSEDHRKEIADIVKILEQVRDRLNAIMDDANEEEDCDIVETALDFLEETLESLDQTTVEE